MTGQLSVDSFSLAAAPSQVLVCSLCSLLTGKLKNPNPSYVAVFCKEMLI